MSGPIGASHPRPGGVHLLADKGSLSVNLCRSVAADVSALPSPVVPTTTTSAAQTRSVPRGPGPGSHPGTLSFFTILEQLGHLRCPFGRYFRLLAKPCHTPESHGVPSASTAATLLPMALPFPHAESASSISQNPSKRIDQRHKYRVLAQRWANRLIAVFNLFDQGALAFKNVQHLSRQPLTKVQSTYANLLVVDLLRWVRSEVPDNALPGSGRSAKLESIMNRIALLGYGSFAEVSKLASHALHVDPSRVSLPETAGLVDPAKYLEEPMRSQYLAVHKRHLPACLWPEIPKSCHKVKVEHELILFAKLQACGMGEWVPEKDVFQFDRDGKPVVISGGFFAVPHKPTSDRLIFDKRSSNVLQRRLSGWARLPHGTQFCQLVLPKGMTVRGSLDDLSCMFYCLSQPHGALKYNVVGRAWRGTSLISAGHLDASDPRPHEKFRFALKVQGMGDCNAVDIATSAHVGLLKQHGCMPEESVMRYDESVPASLTWTGVYIDDKVVVQQLPISKLRDMNQADATLVTKGEIAYAHEPGFTEAKEKRVRFAESFTAWGTSILGRAGKAEAPLEKRVQIVSCAAAIVHRGRSDRKTLEQLIGAFIHPFQHKKCLNCIFQNVYKYMHSLKYGIWYKLPPQILSEIVIASLCMPLASADLRADLSETITCTDATPSAFGVCRSKVDKRTLRSMYRLCEHRGEYVRMDWSEIAMGLHPTRMQKPQLHVDKLLESLKWYVTAEKPFKHIHHVNIQELEALMYEVRERVMLHGGEGARVVSFCDSRVVIGCWSKGRSSSRMLNIRLRKILGYLILGRLSVALAWVGTKSNVSDDPSRAVQLRAPVPLDSETAAAWGLDIATFNLCNGFLYYPNVNSEPCVENCSSSSVDQSCSVNSVGKSEHVIANTVVTPVAPVVVHTSSVPVCSTFSQPIPHSTATQHANTPYASEGVEPDHTCLSSFREEAGVSKQAPVKPAGTLAGGGLASVNRSASMEAVPGFSAERRGPAADSTRLLGGRGSSVDRNKVPVDSAAPTSKLKRAPARWALVKHLLGVKGVADAELLDLCRGIVAHGPWDLIEFYAGHGNLTTAAIRIGMSAFGVEAYPQKGTYVASHDLNRVDVQNAWLVLAESGYIKWAHFGIICKTWGCLHRLFNGGTRTRECPNGDGSRADEIEANKAVAWMVRMLVVLLEAQHHITIENPARSIIFFNHALAKVTSKYQLSYVYVDQCCYGLRSPKGSEELEIWKKPTYFLTSIPELSSMSKHCSNCHQHTHIQGSIRINGKWFNRSLLAGCYPLPLCNAIVRRVSNCFDGPDETQRQARA